MCMATCIAHPRRGCPPQAACVPSLSSPAFSSASSVLVSWVLCSLSFLPCGGELREGEALGVEHLWVLMAPPPASRDAGPVPSWAGLAGVRDSPGTGTSGAGGLVNAVQGCQRHSPRRSGHSVQTPGPQRSLSGGLGRERPAVGPGLAGQMLTRAVLSPGGLCRVTGVVTESRHVCFRAGGRSGCTRLAGEEEAWDRHGCLRPHLCGRPAASAPAPRAPSLAPEPQVTPRQPCVHTPRAVPASSVLGWGPGAPSPPCWHAGQGRPKERPKALGPEGQRSGHLSPA